MAYSERIKNFEKVRAYLRDFYVYGFKSRAQYGERSARSYDDEKRRIESWLGEYMKFSQSAEGKTVFLSMDNRALFRNPLFAAWKTKSFTDGDVTLHFLLFDVLHAPSEKKSLKQILEEIDVALSAFDEPLSFDESTVRKKLQEYVKEGLILAQKEGRQTVYCKSASPDLTGFDEALRFFSEILPCGVIGSFVADKLPEQAEPFTFKHHYITQTMDSEVLTDAFLAITEKRRVWIKSVGKKGERLREVVPLKVFISVQNGRQHLLAYDLAARQLQSIRLDYVVKVTAGEREEKFDEYRALLAKREPYMWGVNCAFASRLERVEFTVKAGEDEAYIVRRLQREKRNGVVEELGDGLYRFSATVTDTQEMIPWMRTFIGRIVRTNFSNRTEENRFWDEVERAAQYYGEE